MRKSTCNQGHDLMNPDIGWLSAEGRIRCRLCRRARYVHRRKPKSDEQRAAEAAARRRRWRETHPEYRTALYEATRDESKAATRAWRLANLDKAAIAGRRWARANPERIANYSHKRRAHKLSNPAISVSKRDWIRLCRRWNNACAYCGVVAPLGRDHIVPLSRGGQHSIGNLLPACRSCNSSKGSRFLIEWLVWRSRAV